MISEWLDSDNFLHTEKNPALDQSENSPMFTGLLSLFIKQSPRLSEFFPITTFIANKSYRANRTREWGSHFSHDNMTGLYCIYKNRDAILRMRQLPILKWNNRWWLHPRDMAFYFWCHHPILGLPFLWIASLAMIVSCIQTYKVRNGKKIIKTDGKLLAYMRCKSFNMGITLAVCTYFIQRHEFFNSWNDVAKMYFKEEGHPLRELIK